MSRFKDSCKKCGKDIEGDSLFCKYCGTEHILNKPKTLEEIAKGNGIDNPIHVSWKKEFLEEYNERWDRYNSQQSKLKEQQSKPKLQNFFKEISMKNLALFIMGIMLLFAILKLPYFYYRILRSVLFVSSIIIAVSKDVKLPIKILLFATAILFNPFEQFTFEKGTWIYIDLILGVIYIIISLIDHFTNIKLTSKD